MHKSLSRFSRFIFIVIITSPAICFSADIKPSQPTKRALLIGIDNYLAPATVIPRLKGAVNDVRLMQELLIGKFGIPQENIEVLINEQATRARILDTIKNHLIAKTNEADVVILHFSGHGSQMEDTSGDEVDNMDETLVPYDGRTAGISDISDDEINGLLLQLTQKTKNVTFIFDSCHSGAAARGGNTVRQIAPDRRTPPPAADFAISARGAEGVADFRSNDSEYVLISGSLAKELSNETLFGGKRHGALTWFLASALKAAPDRITYRDVMDQVKTEINTRFPSQHPQIEGPGQDLVVFGVDKINVKPYVLVEPDGGRNARVAAGKVFGLGKGSILKVYLPRTSDFENTQPVAILKVKDVMDFEAEAEIAEGGPIQPQSRALLEAISFGHTSIPIFVDEKERSGKLSTIREILAEMQAITLVNDETDARLLVKEQDGKFVIQSGDLELLVPPVPVSGTNAVTHVTNQVKDLVHWLVILDLKNTNSGIKIGFDVWRANDPPGTQSPTAVSSGMELRYRVENRHNKSLYIYLLDVSSDGSVELLYPDGGQQELPAGGKWEDPVPFVLYLREGQSAVTDVLKVIATVKPIDPSIFPQGPIRFASQAATRGTSDPLARFLADALRGTKAAQRVLVDSWVTVQKTIKIRREGVKLSSFALHFEGKKSVADIQSRLSGNRDFCSGDIENPSKNCERLVPITKDGTVLDLLSASTARGPNETVSVGQIFDEAYRIQEQLGAKRVEPQLEIQVAGWETEQGIDKRDIAGDDQHDAAAATDDQWSLKQIQVLDAWKKIRDRLNLREGAEANGIIIAHPDTGYTHHPEIWNAIGGKRPINTANGRNYYEGGNDAYDPLLSNHLMDNPGHGTASGSVIISPSGCQLPITPVCVNGIARGAQLVPLRVHRSVAQFNTRNLSQAIHDVAEGKITGNPSLISIAMGGPPTLTMWKAVKAAEKNGVLIVAAAGNNVRTVVWPARFRSVIAVAAGSVRCHPWKGSSRGDAVDIMAPGESVWRATLNEKHEYINAMGKGTTFATGNTAGAAALWLSWHRNDPSLRKLIKQGLLTRTFRSALRTSAWRPSNSRGSNPVGTHCDSSTWNTDYGAGILNVAGLLDVPLSVAQPTAIEAFEEEVIPLFASLYPKGTDSQKIHSDYRTMFSSARSRNLDDLSSFETEILYHYTINKEVQRDIDAFVSGQREGEPADIMRRSLSQQDLSERLRQALRQR